MVWIIVIVIIGYVLYSFFNDREDMLQRQVDGYGGMAKKYAKLIQMLTSEPSARIIKVPRESIHIHASGQFTTANFTITENFNKVVIDWVGQMGTLGNHKYQWKFPHNYPQEKMVQEIGEYMEWKSKQMFGI